MVCGGIFPKSSHLVHDGQPQGAAREKGCEAVKNRRVGVQDVGVLDSSHLKDPLGEVDNEE
jgi:hypothetical protein